MSTSARKRLIVISAVIPVLAAGILGYIDARLQHAPGAADAKAPYILILPSVGNLPEISRVTLTPSQDDPMLLTFTAHDPRIASGMAMILYDEKGRALPEEGRVLSVNEGEGLMRLPQACERPAHADIILAENTMAKRIPVEALRDDTLWKAMIGPDGAYHIASAVTDAPITASGYIDAGPYIETDEYVILNPGPDIKEGMSVTAVAFAENAPPSFLPIARARQASGEKKTLELIARIDMYPAEGEAQTRSEEDAACNVSTPP